MAGDLWTWMALDADNKFIISYVVGNGGGQAAYALMEDMAERLTDRVQLTTDGHKAYLRAIDAAFGTDVDYAMLIKVFR